MIHFSVIIPSFNRANLIVASIESVLRQTFTSWELIIVDDGSTDNTKKIVEAYCDYDRRIKYVYQNNAERCAARNNGIQNAKGKYICFLDSDDYFLENRLELLFKSIENSKKKIAVFYTAIRFEENGVELFVKDPGAIKGNKFDYLYKAVIGTPQLCISKEILNLHQFDENFNIGEDYELLNRIAFDFPLIYLKDQITVVACEHEGRTADLSKSYINHIKMLEYVLTVIQPPFSSAKIPKFYRHDAYFGLAKSYLNENKKYLMFYYLVKASRFSPFRSLKSKIAIIFTSFKIFKPFILLIKLKRKIF
jgi:glycosyltransferase involved in cell wall biosynthesis